MKECCILWPNYSPCDPQDTEGCIEPDGHLGPHRFIFAGGICEWEYDYCGCENCQDQDNNMCITYKVIKTVSK